MINEQEKSENNEKKSMGKIKISHEVPLSLLNTSFLYNDYQYCLPHLMDENEEYRQFFLKCRDEGIEIYMDNSLHELGYAYDSDRLLYWLDHLRPSNFFVPDVWMDKTESIKKAKEWINIDIPDGIKKVAVVQASSYEDAKECYLTYRELGYTKIAFSYGADYYREYYPNLRKGKALALGRVNVIKQLYEEDIINKEHNIHLLGCAVPQEFKEYKGLEFIESLDTSNPIMAAIANMRYTKNGLNRKPTPNMNTSFYTLIGDINLELLTYNIKMFKKINEL
jgi:hypothetical protein